MTAKVYIFIAEQFNVSRCESSIRCERKFDTEAEAMDYFNAYDIANEFRIYTNTEGLHSMEDATIVATVTKASIDEDGWVECDSMDEIASKEYSWADYIEA